MRLRTTALLAVLALAPAASQAQDKKADQAAKKVSVVLAEFNGELREYERELKYFQRAPEAAPLLELRRQLVQQAADMNTLTSSGRGSGPAVLKLARDMDRVSRKLDVTTGELEKRAKAVSKDTDRAAAARMKGHADLLVKTIDKVIVMFR